MYSVNDSFQSYTLSSLIIASDPGVFSETDIAIINALPIGGCHVVKMSKITRTI